MINPAVISINAIVLEHRNLLWRVSCFYPGASTELVAALVVHLRWQDVHACPEKRPDVWCELVLMERGAALLLSAGCSC